MTTRYVLLAAAEADLREIIRYTRQQWGNAQTRSYMLKLQDGIESLATGQGFFKDMSAFHPGLRMARCEHHYIFCIPRNDMPALMVAILHKQMDLMTRLESRPK